MTGEERRFTAPDPQGVRIGDRVVSEMDLTELGVIQRSLLADVTEKALEMLAYPQSKHRDDYVHALSEWVRETSEIVTAIGSTIIAVVQKADVASVEVSFQRHGSN